MSVAELPPDLVIPSTTRTRPRRHGAGAAGPLPAPHAPGSRAGAAVYPLPLPDFKAVLVTQFPDLQRSARRMTKQPALADDLVQDTFRRALEARIQFAPGTNLRAWLLSILRHLYLDHVRRASRETLVGDLGERTLSPAPERRSLWREVTDEDVALALSRLPPIYREPYVLYTAKGCSYHDIARELGIPSGTVGTRLMRAREFLRELLLPKLPKLDDDDDDDDDGADDAEAAHGTM
jgi:RNA polymerase sigma-70 factor, ECF subfamily